MLKFGAPHSQKNLYRRRVRTCLGLRRGLLRQPGLIVLLLVSGILGVCQAEESSVLEDYPGRLIAIGGHKLHIRCTGLAEPTVIFESGLGGFSQEWAQVQSNLGKHVRTCAYDRAGYGWSESGPQPRTITQNVEELHALLVAAGENPPFVLVGHSYGGMIVREFAQQFPEQTYGVVLVDAAAPEQFDLLPDRVLPEALLTARKRGVATRTMPRVNPAYEQEIQTTTLQLMMLPKARLAYRSEMSHFEEAANHLAKQNAQSLQRPLIVVSRSRSSFGHDERGRLTETIWQKMQQRMATLSPRSDHWIAVQSGHLVHLDRPDLVSFAVREVRQKDKWLSGLTEDYSARLIYRDHAPVSSIPEIHLLAGLSSFR